MFRRHKYGAKKTSLAGRSFPSRLEAQTFQLLDLRQTAGEIKDLKHQDNVYLTEARILYKPDFRWVNCQTGETEWGEAKGMPTPVFAIKKRLWKVYGPGKLYIWNTPTTVSEIIIPKLLTQP